MWWGLWVCNPWCKWKRRTHTATYIFFGFGVCSNQNFFVLRTLVLGSSCGKSWICWIFFLGDWEQSMLSGQSVVFLICADSIADHSDDFRGIQGLHCPLCDLCRQVHIITCCGEPQYCTLCSGKRERIAEKESHWPHLSPPSNFTRTDVSSPSPALLSGERTV